MITNIQKHTKKTIFIFFLYVFVYLCLNYIRMKTKKILLKVLDEIEEFEKLSLDITFENFLAHLNNKNNDLVTSNKVVSQKEDVNELQTFKNNNSRDITVLITFMFKYAKNYLKKALEDTLISTPDEFAFLITMMRNDSLSKTELINSLVTEKTSGTETIKRLLKKGLLKEFKSNNDRKSVHVKITEEGKKCIIYLLPSIDKVTKIISGNLTEYEINTLSKILLKLDTFHNKIYLQKRNITIDEIYDNFIVNNDQNNLIN